MIQYICNSLLEICIINIPISQTIYNILKDMAIPIQGSNVHTVKCHSIKVVQFIKILHTALSLQQQNMNQTWNSQLDTHNRHSIPRPSGRAMGCLLCSRKLTALQWHRTSIAWISNNPMCDAITYLCPRNSHQSSSMIQWNLYNETAKSGVPTARVPFWAQFPY